VQPPFSLSGHEYQLHQQLNKLFGLSLPPFPDCKMGIWAPNI
jgi:hypothetical protein